MHYRVTRKTNRRIAPGELFLINSGAQYEDGTTDITRTVAVGTPSEEMRDRFTRVLKGHIAIARAVFPDGTSGAQLDTLARAWLCGRPGSISTTAPATASAAICRCTRARRAFPSSARVALKRGMILSNEPGYYKTGAYGIRIENLVLVTEAFVAEGAEKPLNAFETLTLAPIDTPADLTRRMLTARRKRLVRRLSRARARRAGPLLDAPTQSLAADAATRPLGADSCGHPHDQVAETGREPRPRRDAPAGAADGDDRHRPGCRSTCWCPLCRG